jgi:hypothetical protein
LREGRQSEVTDDLLATLTPNDNAELLRLYNEGATGMDLPMDEASRMARAREAGFDTSVPLYHGGRDNLQNVSRFKGNAEGGAGTFYMTDERSVANSYAPNRTNPSGENIMPLLARSGDYREAGYTRPFPADGTQQQMDAWLLGNDAYNERMSGEGIKSAVYNQQINAARRNNQPGVVMRQTVDNRIDSRSALPSDVFIALDPANIRSRFARFDPRLSDNANLLAANRDQTVGLLSTAAAAEPRNAAERMARDILDMRAAGRAGEVTDAMMAQADPQYMFANTPLPMDEASRMARAREMGFDTGVFKGAAADYANYKIGGSGSMGPAVYVTPYPEVANNYSRGVVSPLLVSGRIEEVGGGPPSTYMGAVHSARQSDAAATSRDWDVAVFDPRNVRSRFARFDPEFAHLANLSAANVDPLAGLFSALAAEEQRRQRNSQ